MRGRERRRLAVRLPRLAWARERRLVSQTELAGLAGISRNTISRLEAGGQAYYSTVRKLAEALGVEPQALMEPVE